MKKILICGDSFSADWTVKYSGSGWPNLLAEEYEVVNLSQAGCSEYKIYLQLARCDIKDFEVILISHTSPYRIHTPYHPAHCHDVLHKDCDFIYKDVKSCEKLYPELQVISSYFEKYFDLDYAKFVFDLIVQKIHNLVRSHPKYYHLTFDVDDLPIENTTSIVNLRSESVNHAMITLGMNHMSQQGNNNVYQKLKRIIET